MKNTCLLACIAFIIAAFLASGCNSGCNSGGIPSTPCIPDSSTGSLSVSIHAQETSMWCWAASAQMCMAFLGTTVQQCDEADKEFSLSDCCSNQIPGPCINGGWPQFGKYSFNASTTSDSALPFAEIQRQICCLKSPVAFSWHYDSGGGHMMVITGYNVVDGVQNLYINDPWPVGSGQQHTITYSEYVSGSDHTHWNDYYNIKKI